MSPAKTALQRFSSATLRFLKDDEAATAAEYGILAALVATAIITAVSLFGSRLSSLFQSLANSVTPKS